MKREVCRVYVDSVVLNILVISHGNDIGLVVFRQLACVTRDIDVGIFSEIGRIQRFSILILEAEAD